MVILPRPTTPKITGQIFQLTLALLGHSQGSFSPMPHIWLSVPSFDRPANIISGHKRFFGYSVVSAEVNYTIYYTMLQTKESI